MLANVLRSSIVCNTPCTMSHEPFNMHASSIIRHAFLMMHHAPSIMHHQHAACAMNIRCISVLSVQRIPICTWYLKEQFITINTKWNLKVLLYYQVHYKISHTLVPGTGTGTCTPGTCTVNVLVPGACTNVYRSRTAPYLPVTTINHRDHSFYFFPCL